MSLVVEVDRGAGPDGLERRVQFGTPAVDDNSGVTPKGFEQREVGENIAARSIQYDCGFVRRIDEVCNRSRAIERAHNLEPLVLQIVL